MISPQHDLTLLYDDLTQPWLAISPELNDEVWQDSQAFSAPGDRRRAYINRLCLKVVVPWLEEELEARATVFPKEKSLASVWEVVGGFAADVKGKRLVIVPTEAADRDELRVPQEWVEIPSWIGDYYLAVQANPEDGWVQVWGYATHAMLKERGSYEWQDRAYSLAGEEIVRDLSLLTLACEGYIEEQTRSLLQPLTPVSEVQAENLLQRLGNSHKAFPRLEIPFPQWAALLEQEEWRDRLYQWRQGKANGVPVNLRQWFENLFEAGWQDPQNLGWSGARGATVQAESALSGLQKSNQEEVWRIKLVDLSNVKEEILVGLLVTMTPQNNEEMQISLQLHPMGYSEVLPEGITLKLSESNRDVLETVKARGQDNCLEFPLFTCSSGDRFYVEIALGDRSVTETFFL